MPSTFLPRYSETGAADLPQRQLIRDAHITAMLALSHTLGLMSPGSGERIQLMAVKDAYDRKMSEHKGQLSYQAGINEEVTELLRSAFIEVCSNGLSEADAFQRRIVRLRKQLGHDGGDKFTMLFEQLPTCFSCGASD